MKLICPCCERRTFYARRDGGRLREPLPDGFLGAVTTSGECTTCWRQRKGVVREYMKSGVTIPPPTFRRPMSDEDAEQVRTSLAKMWAARRRRGIPPEGADPDSLARPGLTLMEV